jgi:MEMO1 family protein
VACLVPHAGYRFSGHVAGAVYARLELPRRFVLIGPRHYPRGETQAILSDGAWQTPLGPAEIDSALAAELKRACNGLVEDEVAHRTEHALEVQLPFLQTLAGEFRFVPIALGTVDFAALESLGRALARVVAQQKEPVLIVASSDMNHYESDEITRRKDAMAIERLLALDARGLHQTVRRESISMCGYGPAVSTLIAARKLGAASADLVRYATSADISGDRDEVVGYAGITIK